MESFGSNDYLELGAYNDGRVMEENIKYMAYVPQCDCDHFCIINKLCRLTDVQSHPYYKIMIPMQPISHSTMQRLLTCPIHGSFQEEAKDKDHDNFHYLEIQNHQSDPH